jgi:phage terminase large subunit-like protein
VDSWLPFGAWEERKSDRKVQPGERITLGFDGSASGDSTALIGCTLDGHLFVVGLWQNDGSPDYRVPREDVSITIDLAFSKYDVLGLYCDPWGYRSEIETWTARYGSNRVFEYNTGFSGRMGPASDRLYQAVMTGQVSHDGDSRLAAHVSHAVAKSTPQGDVVTKDKRGSPRKIDACVAAIVAFDRAAHHVTNPPKRYRAMSFP